MTEQIQVKPNIIKDIEKFGAFDVSACFNCGTCTATCPLSENSNEFPRGIIRLAQLGQKDKLIASKELWICHYCGDCTAACPREANPAQFMNSARKYAIANVDPFGLTSLLNRSKALTVSIMSILAVFVALMLDYSDRSRLFTDDYQILGGYYGEIIHFSGVAIGIFMALAFGLGAFRLYLKMRNNAPLKDREYVNEHLTTGNSFKLMLRSFYLMLKNDAVIEEGFVREDHLSDIEVEEGNYPPHTESYFSYEPKQKVSRRMIHLSIAGGFIGLFLATIYDYTIKDLIFGNPGGWVPIYHPIRLLGILSGLGMMFGTTMSMYYRYVKPDDSEYYKNTNFDDWMILTLIWFVGLTGFFATIMNYIPSLPSWAGWVVIVHVVVVYELFFILPFSKFAHIAYRPLALWIKRYEDEKINFLSNLPPVETEESKEEEYLEVTQEMKI